MRAGDEGPDKQKTSREPSESVRDCVEKCLAEALFLRNRTSVFRQQSHGRPGQQVTYKSSIEILSSLSDNRSMSTETISTEPMEDLKAVCESKAANRPVDPVVARRVQERAAKIKEEIRKRGTTNIAVELIREVRDR